MIKFIVIMLSLVFLFGNMSAEVKSKQEMDNFDISSLSSKGQEAYKKLIKAKQFEDAIVGMGGTLSENVRNFSILLEEKQTDAAFKSILKNGTLPAQLYALSGIYYTDHEHFKIVIEKYKNDKREVQKLSGCLFGEEKVSQIVVSNYKNVAIIKPAQTLEDYWKSNKASYEIDIANGGYSATFRHFAKKHRKEK